jgi:hypothetical protein
MLTRRHTDALTHPGDPAGRGLIDEPAVRDRPDSASCTVPGFFKVRRARALQATVEPTVFPLRRVGWGWLRERAGGGPDRSGQAAMPQDCGGRPVGRPRYTEGADLGERSGTDARLGPVPRRARTPGSSPTGC